MNAPTATTSDLTMADLALALSRAAPGRDAVVGPDGRVTYGELPARFAHLGGMFDDLGLLPGERVGVMLPNGARLVVAMLAAHAAGLVVVPVNTWYRSSELAHVIHTAGIRVLITQDELFGHDVHSDLAAAGYGAPHGDWLGTIDWPADAALPDAAAEQPADRSVGGPARSSDLGLILFTSGSTAQPKPVPLRHRHLIGNGRAIGARMHRRAGDRVWYPLPFFFGFGCSNALPAALAHGATLCLDDRPSHASLAYLQDERCSVYYGLNTVVRTLLSAPDFGSYDLSALRTGTAFFTPEDKRLVIEELGVTEVCSSYGLTEGYGHSAMTDAHDPVDVKLHTQGTALPTCELRIGDARGRPRDVGETGELMIRGAVIDGYFESPELDEGVITPDGWFRTGDLATLDEHGRLRIVGRLKEMLKVKGINIAPAEVEEIVANHADVDQVFVFGCAGEHGDEAMACAVVPQAPVEDAGRLEAELVGFIRNRAASFKVPSRFLVLTADELPTTATGKVSRRLLREMIDGPAT